MFQFFKNLLGTYEIDNHEIIKLIRSVTIDDLVSDVHLRPYYIQDGDTPDSLAQELYGDKDFYWIIMLTGNITDPFYDWPMDQIVLRSYFSWLTEKGEITGTSGDWATLKSENDDKKEINILKPEYVEELIYIIEQTLG